jgi:hypothetical protein
MSRVSLGGSLSSLPGVILAQTSGSAELKQGFQYALGIIFMFGFIWGVIKIWAGANAISKSDPDGKAALAAGIIIAAAAAIMAALFDIFGLSGGSLTPSF